MMPARPLAASSAANVIVTFDVYQPLLPGVPVSEAVLAGGGVSIAAVNAPIELVRPAWSVAKYCTKWCPSPSWNGASYGCHDPLSTRSVSEAIPLVASEAARVTLTPETYQPFSPIMPAIPAVLCGTVVSTDR